MAVARNIGEEQAADAAGSATGNVVDIAATLGLAERLAVDPDIETTQFDATGGKLAAAPDLHALHVLRRRLHHIGIITVERELNRFDACQIMTLQKIARQAFPRYVLKWRDRSLLSRQQPLNRLFKFLTNS